MKILITENQLKSVVIPYFNSNKDIINDELITLKENWSKLKKEEKILVLELYRTIFPEKAKKINEGAMDWIQGGLDLVGIIDPTGIADLTNAVLYFGRGEIIFGMLSLISVVPYVGDLIGKPTMLLAKAGGKEVKLISNAIKTKDAVKIADATASVKNTSFGSKMSNILTKFADSDLGKKIMDMLKKASSVPIVGKFFKAIEGWVDVFKSAGKQLKVPTKSIKGELKTSAGTWKGTLKGSERVDWGSVFKQIKKPTSRRKFRDISKVEDFKVFRELSKVGKKPDWALKSIFNNIIRVPETRKLMNRSKLFLRFLDTLNLGNFIGPDEDLYAKIEDIPNVDQKFADFANTPEGQKMFDEEMGSYVRSESNSANDEEDIASLLGMEGGSLTPDTKMILSQFLKTA